MGRLTEDMVDRILGGVPEGSELRKSGYEALYQRFKNHKAARNRKEVTVGRRKGEGITSRFSPNRDGTISFTVPRFGEREIRDRPRNY